MQTSPYPCFYLRKLSPDNATSDCNADIWLQLSTHLSTPKGPDQSRHGPTAGFSHEGTTAHPEHKVVWLRHVTNDSVRSQTKLTDLPLIIADRRHSLLGHVCRLPPDVPAHNILQHCVNLSQGRCPAPDWKHPPGRPRKTWIQQVEEDHGCTIDSLWSSAQDSSLWRSLRPSLVKRVSD